MRDLDQKYVAFMAARYKTSEDEIVGKALMLMEQCFLIQRMGGEVSFTHNRSTIGLGPLFPITCLSPSLEPLAE